MAADGCVQRGVEEGHSIEIPRGSHFTEPEALGASDPRAAGKSDPANLYVFVKKDLKECISKLKNEAKFNLSMKQSRDWKRVRVLTFISCRYIL
jgi:hypothetical protein